VLLTSSISVQAFLNMGVVVGILPTTGLPLPFFSAGGTFRPAQQTLPSASTSCASAYAGKQALCQFHSSNS